MAMPFLSRIPRGAEWIGQYFPNILGLVLIGLFAMIPAVVVFVAALLSKPPFYFPALGSTLVAVVMLAYWHHDNDLASDAQAAISLIIIPIYVAVLSLAGGVVGVGFQFAVSLVHKEDRTSRQT